MSDRHADPEYRRNARIARQQVTRAQLSVSDVAHLFGVNPATVRRWSDEGTLPCTRTLGGARRFDSDTVEQLRREASR